MSLIQVNCAEVGRATERVSSGRICFFAISLNCSIPPVGLFTRLAFLMSRRWLPTLPRPQAIWLTHGRGRWRLLQPQLCYHCTNLGLLLTLNQYLWQWECHLLIGLVQGFQKQLLCQGRQNDPHLDVSRPTYGARNQINFMENTCVLHNWLKSRKYVGETLQCPQTCWTKLFFTRVTM